MTPKTITSIRKDQIKNLIFPNDEVLLKRKDQIDRFLDVTKALTLGIKDQGKVKIVFVDSEGVKSVISPIWGITDKEIILKQSLFIPLKRILSIS